MVPGSVITVVSRPPTASSRPLDELLGLAGWQLHGVHEGRHDGLVLGGAGGLGRGRGGLRLVRLRRKMTSSSLSVISLGLGATRSACPALTPGPECLWSQVGPGPVGRVLAVRPRHSLREAAAQVRAVHHGVPGSLAACRHRAVPGEAGELLAEQRRLLVEEILLSSLLSRPRPRTGD